MKVIHRHVNKSEKCLFHSRRNQLFVGASNNFRISRREDRLVNGVG